MRIGADYGLLVRSIKSYKDRLVIALSTFGHIEVRVTKLDGVPIGSDGWDSDKAEVLELACYDTRGFTFVTSASSGNAYLLNAKR